MLIVSPVLMIPPSTLPFAITSIHVGDFLLRAPPYALEMTGRVHAKNRVKMKSCAIEAKFSTNRERTVGFRATVTEIASLAKKNPREILKNFANGLTLV